MILRVFLLFLGSLSGLFAQSPTLSSPPSSAPPFSPQDGDCIVFLGDSITHQCLYTQYLENFFLT
ncbi:MAG: GDSL family lipase, partial [Verrucomicrobiota bacterium]